MQIWSDLSIGVVGESLIADFDAAIQPAEESVAVERIRAADVEWTERFRQRYAANSLYQ